MHVNKKATCPRKAPQICRNRCSSGRLLESNVSIDLDASIAALHDLEGLSGSSCVRFYAICSQVEQSVAMCVDTGLSRFDADLGALDCDQSIFAERFECCIWDENSTYPLNVASRFPYGPL